MHVHTLRSHRTWLVFGLLLALSVLTVSASDAAGEVEFPGTVLKADAETGKLAVKKDSGGTRFTFVTNEQTRWEQGLKGIEDLKKDDHVVVVYQTQGTQYIAVRVTPAQQK